MKEFDYSKPKEYTKTFGFLYPIDKLAVKILFKVKFVGFENLPKEGAYILAANHVNKLDPMILSTRSRRPIHFMAKMSLFKKAVPASLLTIFNAFPVDRKSFDRRPIKYAKALLEEGKPVGIFPEGTRSKAKDAAPQEAKTGIALIARESKVGIVPVSIYCPVGEKFFAKMTIRCGEFMPYESLGFSEKSKSSELTAVTNKVMDKIKEMWEEGY